MVQGCGRAAGRRADGLGAERVFRFFLSGCIMAATRTGTAAAPWRLEAMLEKLNPPRIGGTDLYDWDELVQEDRVHRLIYTDPAIFALEMTNIFGAVWVYLGHESQIPAKDDYITVRLGLRPIILLRDSAGKIRALFKIGRASCRERVEISVEAGALK